MYSNSTNGDSRVQAVDPQYSTSDLRFHAPQPTDPVALARQLRAPLSAILQITRRCHLNCVFCSETTPIPDPPLDVLVRVRDHLRGTRRIYLSGGEPLLRNDFAKVLGLFSSEFIVGIPTNALAPRRVARLLRDSGASVTVGLDGPRAVTSEVRGDYDRIMVGVDRLRKEGVPLSISCVVLRSTAQSVPYLCQIADVVGARKIKLILPIPKGNALNLPAEEYLAEPEAAEIFSEAARLKQLFGWQPTITMTTWTRDTEGYAILIYPDAETFAWPVYGAPERVLRLGNLAEESIGAIWKRYPYKEQHARKYLGASIHVTE